MLPEYFEFSLPTKVVYGIGILGKITDAVQPLGTRKAMLVTDEILVKAGPVDKVKAGLKDTGIQIVCTFDKVPPNSTIKCVEDCAKLAKKHQVDLIVAVGGGSVIDTAKVANIIVKKGGKLEQHMGAYLLDPNEQLLPMIVVPTTAGTGSEVTKVAVILDPDNNVKLPFAEEQFLPQLAVLDPEVTVSMPGKLTAATGMDALTHAIEAYVDKEWSPASDALALHAIRLISRNILQACAKPDDLQARGAMLVGSFLAGVAFSHSMCGLAHGIAHALGGAYHIPHGLANALTLPEVMEYNLESQPERYAEVALALGVSFPQIVGQSQSLIQSGVLPASIKGRIGSRSHKVRGLAARAIGNLGFIDRFFQMQAARAGVEKIRTLNRQLSHLTGMPLNLKDAGVADHLAKLEEVADKAMEDGTTLYNPREPQRDDVVSIVKKIYDQQVCPLPVSDEDLRGPAAGQLGDKEIKGYFKDSETLYDVLINFFEKLKAHPQIGPSLKKSNLIVQFRYKNPDAVITIDASGDEVHFYRGEDFKGTPEVTMSMNADFAHKFWHGKANLITALTRRQVQAKGNVPKTVKLLPVLFPAYDLYPKYLREKGLDSIVIT
jgi:alcohol dehydrogenase class IV